MQIEPYLEAFGRERVLPVFFERLTSEPQAELERVCRFLGYEKNPLWQADLDQQNVSNQRIRKSPLLDLLIWNSASTYLRKRLVPQSLRDRVKGFWQLKGKPELSPETEAFAIARFDADLARLGKWFGAELDCSNFAAVTGRPSLDWCNRG
jgi:hypothetical protein